MKPPSQTVEPNTQPLLPLQGEKVGNLRLRILLPFLVAMAILLATFCTAIVGSEQVRAAAAVERNGQQVQVHFRDALESKMQVMSTISQAILNDGQLANHFAARDRDAVIARAEPLFQRLGGQHGITHFYFHELDGTNFLRVHRPQEHGDLIARETMQEAIRTGTVAAGLERGPVGTFVLRVVTPWSRDGLLLGYIELGVEFSYLVQEIHRAFAIDMIVAVNKENLNRATWENSVKKYGRVESWDQFRHVVVMDKTMPEVPSPIVEHLNAEGGMDNHEVHEMRWGERLAEVVHHPLHDLAGRRVGEIIILRDITEAAALAKLAVWKVVLSSLAVIAVLTGFFYHFLGRVEHDLKSRTDRLVDENLERQKVEQELRAAQEHLEVRVEERTSALASTNQNLMEEMKTREAAQLELQNAQRDLMEASRQAGMAEVATSVLHNVGNVLNSVNVTTTLVSDRIQRSKSSSIAKVSDLLKAHEHDLGDFMSNDPKGKQLPAYLENLSEHLAQEQLMLKEEMRSLQKNVEHIKDIVAMQQCYAKVYGFTELITPREMVEDALHLNAGALVRHEVNVLRDYNEAVAPMTVEKHKVLQILVNLIRNAKYACDEAGRADKQMTLRIAQDEDHVLISVADNGVGIAPENMNRIFSHGFTTRSEGHGFGLHSSALVAKEMHGSLEAYSDGIGKGATFTLRLPLNGYAAQTPE